MAFATAQNIGAQPTIIDYPLAAGVLPQGIAPGPDGSLWIAEFYGNKIAKVTTGGVVTEYPLPRAQALPLYIVLGPDGNLWFTESSGIGKITPAGIITDYPTAIPGRQPYGITVGGDGNLWFTEATGAIGKITTAGAITEYPVAGSSPAGISWGPDGNLWSTDGARPLVRRMTAGGSVTEFPLPLPVAPLSHTTALTVGPDGNIWVASDGYISKVTTAGQVTLYIKPPDLVGSFSILPAPDGALWFSAQNRIGRITVDGAFSEYQLPTIGGGTAGLAVGADGNLWFMEPGVSKFGKLVLATVPPVSRLTYSPTAFTFNAARSGQPPASQTLTVTAPAGAMFTASSFVFYSLQNSWLKLPAGTLTAGQPVTVGIDQSGLAAGTYTGAVLLQSGNVTQDANVTLNVSDAPPGGEVSVQPASFSFQYTIGSLPPITQTLFVQNPSSVPFALPFTVTYSVATPAGGAWLKPTLGGTPILSGDRHSTGAGFTIGVDPTGLAARMYSATITITPDGGMVVNVPITLTVANPTAFTANPGGLSFSMQASGGPPAAQTVQIVQTGASASFNIQAVGFPSWLQFTPQSGASGGTTLTVSITPAASSLAAGVYDSELDVLVIGGIAVKIPVRLTVIAGGATISVTPSSLNFFLTSGSPATQTVQVAQTSTTRRFTVAPGASNWYQVSPLSGIGSAVLSVSIMSSITSNLPGGTYTDQIQITPDGGTAISLSVTVFVPSTGTTVNASPSSLSFTCAAGGAAPAARSVQLTETGPHAAYAITVIGAPWLAVTPFGATGAATLTASVTPPPGAGTYQGTIRVTVLPGPTPFTDIPVDLTVALSNAPSTLTASPAAVNITSLQNAVPQQYPIVAVRAPNNASVPVTIATPSDAWLRVSNVKTSTPVDITVGYDPKGLAPGTYTSSITITPATGIALTVPVLLIVNAVTPAVTVTANPSSVDTVAVVGLAPDLYPKLVITASGGTSVLVTVVTPGDPWLRVQNGAYTTPATIDVAYDPTLLGPGVSTSSITITPTGAAPITVPIRVTAVQVVNAASFLAGPIAPGEIVTITGAGLGPATAQGLVLNADGTVSSEAGGLRVLFNGTPAPLIYASADQINCVLPYEAAGTPIAAQIAYGGQAIAFNIRGTGAAPGVFTANGRGAGPAAALNATGGYNGPDNPAPAGSTVTFYVTGEGQTSPVGATGSITIEGKSGVSLTPQPLLPVAVTIGGETASIGFYGEAPGLIAGVMQLNVEIPPDAPTGDLPLVVTVGGIRTQAQVTLSVR